jgi:hypothetical protein
MDEAMEREGDEEDIECRPLPPFKRDGVIIA